MAKQQKQSENVRYAVNKKALKNARAQAALEQAQQEARMEKREKSRRMSTAFLLGVLGLIGLFCLYTLLRTLLIRRAASLEDLRANLLFVSVVSIPYLLGFGAYLAHRLLKKQRESWSDRAKRLGSFLLVLAFAAAFLLFALQFRGSRSDASGQAPYANTLAALKQSGLELQEPERVDGLKTLLEQSVCTELRCGRSSLRLNWHSDSAGGIAGRFLDQAAWDYADYPLTETETAKLWGPAGTEEAARAALAGSRDGRVLILELAGPRAELETLLPLLTASLAP